MSQRNKYVEIANAAGEHAKVMPSSVKLWERNGWTVVDDGSSETRSDEHPQGEDQHQLSLLDDKNKE
jgi:hypothetical protein